MGSHVEICLCKVYDLMVIDWGVGPQQGLSVRVLLGLSVAFLCLKDRGRIPSGKGVCDPLPDR